MPAFDAINRFRLDGQVSLVTGGSRGLGRAIAEALAGAGSDVIITGRQLSTLEPVAAEIHKQTGRRVVPLEMDVANVPDQRRGVDRIIQEFGRLDVLVNNAGINERMATLEYTEEAWDRVTDVNLRGAFFLCQAVGKVMIPQRRG
jgi:NAD(P)-dependent dehydrogenase (short-subunit alcohol dehydrogenase family)